MNDVTRRKFIQGAAVAVAGSASVPLFRGTLFTDAAAAPLEGATWSKAPCRFCGTGCGVEVAVKAGRIVAARGDEESPVNRGLLCAKGYALAQVLYAEDRLKRPMIRDASGVLQESTWEEALDLIASRWSGLIAEHGPDAVAIYGSGQWTIPEGYAALKLAKGGIRTNNLEPNARLCMASAVVGHITTYGIDEPPGCYDDFDLADVFFMWGANMAEMHPMLFHRILQRKAADANVRIINLSTFGQLTEDGADETHIFKPHSDLYLGNAIAHVLVAENLIDEAFIANHVNFEQDVDGAAVRKSLQDYVAFLADFAPGDVADAVGITADEIARLARLYGDPKLGCVSTWTMGFNQHTRGVWMNNLVHNLHLLTGKVSRPGNSPFSLTGQPSACGTCREVGTFTHRLPSDRVVANPQHRAEIEELWDLPKGTIPSPEQSPLTHAVAMWEKVANGSIKSVWVSVSNPFQTLPNLRQYRQAIRDNGAFVICSDIYPSVTTAEADVVLPAAGWAEKEGMFGNSERRTQHFARLVDPPGEAKSDAWQFAEVARRMGHGALFPDESTTELERELYEDYRRCTLGTAHDIATYEDLVASRGLRWPVVDGRETPYRFNADYDPYVSENAIDGIEFYGKEDGRAVVWLRPYEPPAEIPDETYPFWLSTGRVLEHWHTGTMTRRVPQLHRAVPEGLCYLNDEDAADLGIAAGDTVQITSRRGSLEVKAELECRIRCPRGMIYVPFFDESRLINEVTLGAIDPQSKQPDYKKCAVRVERVAS